MLNHVTDCVSVGAVGGQRKAPSIGSTQGREKRRKNLGWALEVVTNLKWQGMVRK